MPPIDDLPGELILPSRDDVRDQYLRDVRIRTPGAVTVEGTLDYADASVFADSASPIYFDAKKIGDYVANVNKSGPALDAELVAAGTSRLNAAGGSGYVVINASTGGGTIFEGDEIKDLVSGLRFQCTATALYNDGSYVPIAGVDTGPSTNIDAGASLQWTFPRPGISPTAIVVEQTDGTGLSGGRNEETDDEANRRLRALRANPPAAGNDAAYQAAASKTPGVPIQQPFTYPGILGAGTIGVTFTLRPGTPGANRIPNPSQLSALNFWLVGQFPADDGIFVSSLIAFPVNIVFEILWAPSAVSWADASPWPLRLSTMVSVDGAVTPTATSFRLSTTVTTADPQVGQTIAVYDQANGIFRRKRIGSVAVVVSGQKWDITADTVNAASDIDYTPFVGQAVGPWSDSLPAIVPPVTEFFDGLGPGEQVSDFPDPELRQHRTPRSPNTYGNTITNRVVINLFNIDAIGDIELISPNVPFDTPVGAQGIFSYLLSLGSIVAFPQT